MQYIQKKSVFITQRKGGLQPMLVFYLARKVFKNIFALTLKTERFHMKIWIFSTSRKLQWSGDTGLHSHMANIC